MELETEHEKIVTEVRKLLDDSVKEEDGSDVPIGAYLSGRNRFKRRRGYNGQEYRLISENLYHWIWR